MSGIVGVRNGPSSEASTLAHLMLDTLKHRGPLREVESIEGSKRVGLTLGSVSHEGSPRGIVRSATRITALSGSFYERSESSLSYAFQKVTTLPCRTALRELTGSFGGFAGLVAGKDSLYGFRDVNGLKPLYYARSSGLAGFASERKALWRIGLKTTRAVPPGSVMNLAQAKMVSRRIVRFARPKERKISFGQASAALRQLLSTSVRSITSHEKRICVAFSGGLDSAVTAVVAKRLGVDLEAISVGLDGSPEICVVERFADQLGLPITIEKFRSDSVEEYVKRILWLIEEPNLMKVSVAIPLHWAAMVAARRGQRIMLCGQGSDELYGGYSKYAATLRNEGREALKAQLYRSVIESSLVNYERDEQATSPFPIELRTPFSDPDLIRFSLSIPSEFKVKDGQDVTRKWILRDVAKAVGVPEEIAFRRKKAIQHGTGVEKAILKLAKNSGLNPDEYLSKTFDDVVKMESMP